MTKSKDIKNSSYADMELNELLSNYNGDRYYQAFVTRNFNEIDTPPARIEGAASGEGNPHKLYNNFSDLGLELRMPEKHYWREHKTNGDVILHYSDKVPPAFSNAEIEAL